MKHKCSECHSITACRYTFGRFYNDKSCGGVGCDCRFAPDMTEFARATARVERLKASVSKKTFYQAEIDF